MPRPNLRTICQSLPCKMSPKITFFDLVTLTFDLWPWPPGSTSRSSMFMLWPNLGTTCQAVPKIWILVTSHANIQKAMHKSPPCIHTGGLKKTLRSMHPHSRTIRHDLFILIKQLINFFVQHFGHIFHWPCSDWVVIPWYSRCYSLVHSELPSDLYQYQPLPSHQIPEIITK